MNKRKKWWLRFSLIFATVLILCFGALQTAKAIEIPKPVQNEERPERPPWWPPRPSGLF